MAATPPAAPSVPAADGSTTGRVSVAAATDVGHVRRRNEDHAVVGTALVTGDHDEVAEDVATPALLAVLDGMGGHPAGDVASGLVARVVVEADLPVDRDGVAGLVADMQHRLIAHMEDHPETTGMGTTLSAVSLTGPSTGLVIGIGDSAALWWTDELVDVVPRDRGPGGWITQVLGGATEPDHLDAHVLELTGPGRLLLATDGLTDVVEPGVVAMALRDHAEPAKAARALVDAALERGAPDNVTVVVADFPAPA